MKKIIPFLIYIILTTLLFILANFRISEYVIWIFVLNIIFTLIYFTSSFIDIIKSRFRSFKSYILLLMSPTFIIVFLKLDFERYHFYYHLAYTLILAVPALIIYKNQKKFIKNNQAYIFLILLNITILCLNDYYIFKFWNNDKISWSTQKLEWNDYKQSVPYDQIQFNAITTNGIQWKVSKTNNTPSILVIGFMKPSESWVKETHKTDNQLRHERLYLDICELYARKIRKIFDIKKYSIDENGRYSDSLNNMNKTRNLDPNDFWQPRFLIRKIIDNKNAMANQYMRETKHGKDIRKQEYWESKVAKELDKLVKYKI